MRDRLRDESVPVPLALAGFFPGLPVRHHVPSLRDEPAELRAELRAFGIARAAERAVKKPFVEDLRGFIFGPYTVVRRGESPGQWICRRDDGLVVERSGDHLRATYPPGSD